MDMQSQGDVHTADDAALDGAVNDGVQGVADDKAAPYEPTPYDALARDLGWRSPDEYAGDKPFRSAEDYIKSAVNGASTLRKDFKETKKTLERLTRTVDVTVSKAVKAEREKLEGEYAAAVEAGDARQARQLSRELDQMESQAAPRNYEADFATNNPWYGKDEEATAYAVSVSQRAAGQGKTPEEQLEAAAAAVRKRFPELYDDAPTPARKAPSVNAPATRAASLTPRAKGFSDLPQSAKDAWAKFDKDFKGRGFKDGYPQAEFAKDYWAENG